MLSRRLRIIFALCTAQLALLVATPGIPGFGAAGWHHLASLLAVLGISFVFRRPLSTSRRFLALGVIASTLLATASGFWLLYWKEGIRVAGYQDWGVFWHVAWSWAATVFFFQHTWINRVALLHFVRRSIARMAGAAAYVGISVALCVVVWITWTAPGKDGFTAENYVPISLYAWLLVATPAYALWLVGAFKRRPERTTTLRGPVDVVLTATAVLVVVTGVLLVWWDPFMDASGWKYVSKFWHVWPSVLFSVLVFAHTVHVWSAMRIHWDRIITPASPREQNGPGTRAS